MSLNPWLPVPMIATAIRLLGATAPESPSAEPGTIVGKAKPAAEAWSVCLRNSRREAPRCADSGRSSSVLLVIRVGVIGLEGRRRPGIRPRSLQDGLRLRPISRARTETPPVSTIPRDGERGEVRRAAS